MNEINCFEGDFFFLSNFYASEISTEWGLKAPTVEHAFQAAKSTDKNIAQRILLAETPGHAKRIGRTIPLRKDWEEVKIDIMKHYIRLKFQNPELRKQLINTYPATLVEGNWWHDNCWGSCSCGKCANKFGQNHLGKILMEIRKECIEEEYEKEQEKDE